MKSALRRPSARGRAQGSSPNPAELVGCAVGGSRQGAPDHAVAALKPLSGPEQASLFGRKERRDALHTALVNGISSHVLDYDDTHLKSMIQSAGPVASALTAFAEYRPVSETEFMNALVLGCENECRMCNSMFPEHYARGWHITGTCGVRRGRRHRPATEAGRAIHGLGDRPSRLAAGGAEGAVRVRHQELSSRPGGAEWHGGGADGAAGP